MLLPARNPGPACDCAVRPWWSLRIGGRTATTSLIRRRLRLVVCCTEIENKPQFVQALLPYCGRSRRRSTSLRWLSCLPLRGTVQLLRQVKETRMLGVRKADGLSEAPAVQAVAPQATRETPTAGPPGLLDRLREALLSRHYSRRTGFDLEVLMRIRIAFPDNCANRQQVLEGAHLLAFLARTPKAAHADRNGHSRILCGSI